MNELTRNLTLLLATQVVLLTQKRQIINELRWYTLPGERKRIETNLELINDAVKSIIEEIQPHIDILKKKHGQDISKIN